VNKMRYLIISAAILLVLTGYSCDRRGGSVTGVGTAYILDIIPFDTLIVPDDVVRIACFVSDMAGNQVGGVMVNFEAVESGYITSEKESSASDTVDGLVGTMYFDPRGVYGEVHLVAEILDDEVVIASDTALVYVLPYTFDFVAVPDTLHQSESSDIYCRVINPLTSDQSGGINLEFTAPDFGFVSPTAKSDETEPSGMETAVIYIAPDDTSGEARIIVEAKFGYSEPENMGSDTLNIVVLEN